MSARIGYHIEATRAETRKVERYEAFGLVVEPDERRMFVRGRAHRVAPQRARILARLAKQPGRCVTRDSLIIAAWGDDEGDVNTESALMVQISVLRRQLRDVAAAVRIVNVFGVGWRLEEDGAS